MEKGWLLFILLASTVIGNAQYIVKLTDVEMETETKQIREYFKKVNKEKTSYQQSRTFWSYDEELREKYGDSEYEYNEEGNEEQEELTYSKNEETILIVRDTRISKFQVPYNETIHEEYYFQNNELVFFYSKTHETLTGPDYMDYTDMEEGGRAVEIRIYLKNKKIFKYLIKEAVTSSEDEIDASDLLLDMENKSLDIETLTDDDFNPIVLYLN